MRTKQKVLELLEKRRGESISGERIAAELSVSRNAVWKAIKDLQKDGYSVTAVTNKGYCLEETNDILSSEGIKPYLSDLLGLSDGDVKVFATIESTNKTAKELALTGADHGTTVIADCQTMGRGRYSRSFFSPSGDGIYMTVILRPDRLKFTSPAEVTSFAAVCVAEAIEAVSDRNATIKWVNDIYLDGKKTCGILTEAITDFESGELGWIVVGIGVNVYTKTEDFPEEIRSVATSVFPDGVRRGVRNRLCAEILNRVLLGAESLSETEIFEKYRARLNMLGDEITVIKVNDTYRAKALDIDRAGHLIVRRENGEIETLSSGEISIRK